MEVEDGRWLGLGTIDDHDDNCDDNRLAVGDGVGRGMVAGEGL
jgi:hypothetical protein